jgi:hypothetical protein
VKDDRLYLGHILEAAERIVLYGRDGEESFRTDLRTQDAIIRNLQVMGEAVKKVSLETREAHPGGAGPGCHRWLQGGTRALPGLGREPVLVILDFGGG